MTAVKGLTGLAGFLGRFASVVRLVRPVETPAPDYTRCAGCGQGGRDDQLVPDPGDGTAVQLINAAPVWCASCKAWYHGVHCYSLHRRS